MNNASVNQKEYLKKRLHHKRMVTIMRILILVLFIALWEITARLGIIDSFIFSSPSRVLNTFISMVQDKTIFLHVGVTLAETLISFALVVLLGIATAVLLWLSKKTL